jgi:hypothetical protein
MNNTQVLTATSANAVQGMSFCSVWPMAKGILSGVLPSVSNPTLKTAINALIAAADAVCSSSASASASERLARFGLVASPDKVEFLSSLTDEELEVLAAVQRTAVDRGVINPDGVGSGLF